MELHSKDKLHIYVGEQMFAAVGHGVHTHRVHFALQLRYATRVAVARDDHVFEMEPLAAVEIGCRRLAYDSEAQPTHLSTLCASRAFCKRCCVSSSSRPFATLHRRPFESAQCMTRIPTR